MEDKVTLLIADDEAEIRAGLRNIIDWKEYNIDLVGTAGNGAEALEMIRYYEPDIVITDIQMPVLGGLEMIARARGEQFDCLFVILSGYDDFHYAQTAIKQGVNDYILKPIDTQEFIDLIRRLSGEVLLKRNIHQHQVRMSRKLNAANKAIRQQNFISELLREELSEAQIAAVLQNEQMPVKNHAVAAVIVYLYGQDLASLADDEEIKGSIPLTLDFLNLYCQARPAIYAQLDRSAIVIVQNADSPEALLEEVKKLIRALKSERDIQAFGAAGTIVASLKNINESFRIASQAASWHIYPQLGEAADASVLLSVGSQHLIKDERIINDIKSGNADALKANFERYTKALFFTEFPPPAYLFSMYNFLIMDVRSQLAEMNLKSYTGDAYQAMRQFDTLAEIKNWVLMILLEFANEFSVSQARLHDPLIQKAVEFITANIFNKVAAEDVCRHIGYSSSYFSKYFRQKTNLNLRDYILDLKITCAQEQLKSNDHSPKEVAIMLGYEEYSSFSRAFKARTGFSPSDYQKSFY